MASAGVPVPRNFKLLDELADAEKGSSGGADISLGLCRPDDTYMSDWQASIFFGAGGGEARLWSITIHAGDKYPAQAPQFKFSSKISLECVDARGNVNIAKVPYLAAWNSSKTMLGALQEIKSLMARAPRAQPPEGANY